MNYDVVWYWSGGTERGGWHPAWPSMGETLHALQAEIRKGGRVALLGKRSIGPPDDGPSEGELEEVLRWRGAAT